MCEHVGSGGISRRALLLSTGISAGALAVGANILSPVTPAVAAYNYARPCGDVTISDSWLGHKNRTPPSAEPGTDYAVAHGTPVVAATSGRIVSLQTHPGAASGRYVALQADDGNYFRYLHLGSITVFPGTRVQQGDLIAYSGASGFGSDTYYGAHVHISMWLGTTPDKAGFKSSVDFENYVSKPLTPEETVPTYHRHQGNYTVPIGTGANSRLYFSSGDFDMAKGAGGPGLYQITTHATFAGLTPEKVLMLQYYLLRASDLTYSDGFSATFPGVVGGVASVEFSTIIVVPTGYHLFVAARCPQGGVNQTSVAKMSLNFGNI